MKGPEPRMYMRGFACNCGVGVVATIVLCSATLVSAAPEGRALPSKAPKTDPPGRR